MPSEVLIAVTSLFENFLNSKKLRKTHERMVILKEIYSLQGHFDMDLLYKTMRQKKTSYQQGNPL